MTKKFEAKIHNMHMLPLNHPILMMSMREDEPMNNAKIIKKLGKGSELPTPIRLNHFNGKFVLKFNHCFELLENIKSFKFGL